MPENTEEDQHPGAAVVYSYSRSQAIEDGVLIDVTETAQEAGFKYPVAVTEGVMNQVVLPSEKALAAGESASGRLWDVIWMCASAARRISSNDEQDEVSFEVLATDQFGVKQLHQLWSKCGPGDTVEPVVTIMLQGED